MSQRIIEENLTPNFRNEAYGAGLTEAINRMTPLLRGEVVELPEKKGFDSDTAQAILILIAFLGW